MAESAETLADPHLEEISIMTKVGNIDLIISNIYVSPASSFTGGYILSLYNLLKTTNTLIPGDLTTRTTHNSTETLPIREAPSWTAATLVSTTGTPPQDYQTTPYQVHLMFMIYVYVAYVLYYIIVIQLFLQCFHSYGI